MMLNEMIKDSDPVLTNQILTFYSAAHKRHDPPREVLHGKDVPFFEMPKRITNIKNALDEAGLIYTCEIDEMVPLCELHNIHDPRMVSYLKNLSENVVHHLRDNFGIYHMEDTVRGDEYYYESVFPPPSHQAYAPEYEKNFFIYDNTSPVGAGTWSAVHHAASLAYAGAQAIVYGEQRAFAMCRPPGHHAGRDFMGGYCYFNNAALGANILKRRGRTRTCGRVAILDIDYHHGNGTQHIFWNDPNVLFTSIHADPQQDYPYYTGFASETGGECAEGTNLNLPLPHGTGEAQYMDAFAQAADAIKAFAPQALVVSLGWDAYKKDPISHFKLDIESFYKLGQAINAFDLPTLYVQEGGYALDDLGEMAKAFFTGVLE